MMPEEIHPAMIYKSDVTPRASAEAGLNNPLLEAAMPLILLFIQLKETSPVTGANQLRQNIIHEVDAFTKQAKAANCPPQLILAARYCLCTALDEAILLTSWGAKNEWGQQSLLSCIHRETWGGERFFIILEKMVSDSKKNSMILDLLYLLLSLGYEGKYYNENRILREELQHQLYKLLIHEKPEVTQCLSPRVNIIKNDKVLSRKKRAYWGFWASVISAVLGIGIIFNILLYWKAKPFLQNLIDISTSHSVFIPSQEIKKKPEKHHSSHLIYRHSKHKLSQPEENIILPPPAWRSE